MTEDKTQLAVSTYDKIAQIYTNHYFDDLSDAYYLDRFCQELSPSARILDVGCGPGSFSKYLLKKGLEVTGIDLSSEMLKIANKLVPTGTFQQMDMRNLSFPEASFDGLLVAYSLIHIETAEIPATLAGFKRVLKPHGKMLIILQSGEPDQIVDESFMPGEKMFFNFFSPERLVSVLSENGFSVVWQETTPSQDAESMTDTLIFTLAQLA